MSAELNSRHEIFVSAPPVERPPLREFFNSAFRSLRERWSKGNPISKTPRPQRMGADGWIWIEADTDMIEQRNATQPGYGIVAKSLHWLILALLIAQYAIAWTMPHIGRGTQPGTLINLHLSVGVLVLVLALARLGWRAVNPVPLIRDNVPWWQLHAAQALHGLLYLLIFAIPTLGWAASSMRGWSVDFFGLFTLPPWLAPSSLAGPVGDLHTLCTYILLGAVAAHVLAALYHQLVLRDRVLLRMLPG